MDRKVTIWNFCSAKEIRTDLQLEKVLSVGIDFIGDTHTEVVFSTPNKKDIKLLRQDCSCNLWLRGETEQLLLNVVVASDIVQHGDRFVFTLAADWII